MPRKTLYAPTYYAKFKCIADQCRHSCCVDWEICIDDRALEKYKELPEILDTVVEGEDGSGFALGEGGKCPHLRADGLCNIICTHGEGALCDICRNHPRFFHDSGTRRELGLGLVCEEACRLILTEKYPFLPTVVGDIADSTADFGDFEPVETYFDPLPLRDRILELLEETSDLAGTIETLRATLNLPEMPPAAWLDRFSALERLDPAWGEILEAAKTAPVTANAVFSQYAPIYARLCAYFVYRHVSVAESLPELRIRVAFALLSTEMIGFLLERAPTPTTAELLDLARRYSAEIEYSVQNTNELLFELVCRI